jgi:hypothetical protein
LTGSTTVASVDREAGTVTLTMISSLPAISRIAPPRRATSARMAVKRA